MLKGFVYGIFKRIWGRVSQRLKPKPRKKPISKSKVAPARSVTDTEPVKPVEYTEADLQKLIDEVEKEYRAEFEFRKIKEMIEKAEFGDFSPSATLMIAASCDRLNDIFREAESRLSAVEIMDRLKSLYGYRLEGLTQMIDSLIYAVYNKNNSGFAKWSGRGARARWEAEVKRIEGVLQEENFKNLEDILKEAEIKMRGVSPTVDVIGDTWL